MFRVCDADVLMTPGNIVFYVVKDHGTDKFEPEVLVEDTLTSAHREIDMMVIHNDSDEETGLPVISYVVKGDEIHYEPRPFNVITSNELLKLLEYDDTYTTIEVAKPGLVASITISRTDDHNVVHIETASQIVQTMR